jgi:hypothetical protein
MLPEAGESRTRDESGATRDDESSVEDCSVSAAGTDEIRSE